MLDQKDLDVVIRAVEAMIDGVNFDVAFRRKGPGAATGHQGLDADKTRRARMPIRLAAFDLDGTLIRGQNSLAVIGAALRHPEWEQRMEILYMRGATPGEMEIRVALALHGSAPHQVNKPTKSLVQ